MSVETPVQKRRGVMQQLSGARGVLGLDASPEQRWKATRPEKKREKRKLNSNTEVEDEFGCELVWLGDCSNWTTDEEMR
jgi:hypothetical protein